MSSKPQRISARISNELKTRIARVEAATGLSEAQQIEACAIALVEFFETHGSVTLPLAVIPRAKEKVTIPTPSFPSTARAAAPGTPSLNESAPHVAVPPRSVIPASGETPLVTKTRRALRSMAAKEKPKA